MFSIRSTLVLIAASAGAVQADWYKPAPGTTWQIVLQNPLDSTDLSMKVDVFDSDLFANTADLIKQIHAAGKRSICYFSAGSFENWRPDAGEFNKTDYGHGLDGWPGEYWLNTNSANVRRIMEQRLDQAASKGCDAVDPDNIDGYDNDNGLGLTQEDATEYVKFLAQAAHSRNMAVGLKNGGDILPTVVDDVDFSVNEQCVAYQECDTYAQFIQHNKPVFHIEYVDHNPSTSEISKACTGPSETNFSTIIKHMSLNDWAVFCPQSDTASTTATSSGPSASASPSETSTSPSTSPSASDSADGSDTSNAGSRGSQPFPGVVTLLFGAACLSVFL